MKQFLPWFLVGALVGAIISGCYESNEIDWEKVWEKDAQKVQECKKRWSGQFLLRKVKQKDETEGHIWIGKYTGSGSIKQDLYVYIAFLDKDSTYAIKKLKWDQVRIKTKNVEQPYVEFKYANWKYRIEFLYALITCKDSDWPIEYDMPLNSQ